MTTNPLVNIFVGYFSAWISASPGSAMFSKLVIPELLRAPWTPPGIVFGIVWNIAFYWLALEYRHVNRWMRTAHFLLLHTWTPIFFGLQMYKASLAILAASFVLSAWIAIRRAYHVPHGSLINSVAWVLFLSWMAFAASLNIYSTSVAVMKGIDKLPVNLDSSRIGHVLSRLYIPQ